MVKIEAFRGAVKTLILEILSGNGACHIKEIHLQVTELRPEIPQHTIRARLSEMSRAQDLEEKLKAYGRGFYGLYQENHELCSVVSYPDRGPWGDSMYRGNCSGHLVKDLILRFNCQSVFGPAEGSGTVRDVVSGINRSAERIYQSVKPGGILTILIGDKRRSGNYYALFRSLLMNPNIGELKAIIIKMQHNCTSDRVLYSSRNPLFIPIKHEYCLVFQKASERLRGECT